ncbi:winged helix-turn-helix transcriptional regulator [uncultured Desulfosarcina sp.]|uniref:winged helix-turn-helix transcriptional regulator n=1 Tax=uncultured Desulfosarcina sp. TaxID=218289 RepID=UPI0029C6E280|nr:winged helix-turn-helix transcriptional regulator [uncultured Desulfosarcina sp.]
MESKNFKTLQLLEAIAEERPTSQRELSDVLQVSLGMVNAFIKRLVKKGYCKVTTIPKNRVQYILTPAGAMEKTRLTYKYISSSYQYFKTARKRLHDLYDTLQDRGATRIVFYGAGEFAHIAYLSMTGTRLELIDVVDPNLEGQKFAHLHIQPFTRIQTVDYDILLITTVDNHGDILNAIRQAGVPQSKVMFF